MSVPAPLTPDEILTLAASTLERLELADLTIEQGESPARHIVTSAVATAVALHREVGRTLDAWPVGLDEERIADVTAGLDQVEQVLATSDIRLASISQTLPPRRLVIPIPGVR